MNYRQQQQQAENIWQNKYMNQDYPLTENQGPSLPSIPQQNYLSIYEKAMLKPKQYDDIDIDMYQRKLLTNQAADPQIFDDKQRDQYINRRNVMNLREFGQTSNIEPFLNEVTLHDQTPDPRGTDNKPDMNKIKQQTYQKQAWIKMNLFPDNPAIKELGGNITQEEERDNKHKMLLDLKQRLQIFDIERQGYNPQRKPVQSNDPSQINQLDYDQAQNDDNLATFKQSHVIPCIPTQLKFNSLNEPDHLMKVADFSQVYYTTYHTTNENTIGNLYKMKDQKSNYESNNPLMPEFLTGKYTNKQAVSDPISKVLLTQKDNKQMVQTMEMLMKQSKSMQLPNDPNSVNFMAFTDQFVQKEKLGPKNTVILQKGDITNQKHQVIGDQSKLTEFLTNNQKHLIMQGLDPYTAKLNTIKDISILTGIGEQTVKNIVNQTPSDINIVKLVILETIIDNALKNPVQTQKTTIKKNNTDLDFDRTISNIAEQYVYSNKNTPIPQLITSNIELLQFQDQFSEQLKNIANTNMYGNDKERLIALRNKTEYFQNNQDYDIKKQLQTLKYIPKNINLIEHLNHNNTHISIDPIFTDKTINYTHIRGITGSDQIRNNIVYEQGATDLNTNSLSKFF